MQKNKSDAAQLTLEKTSRVEAGSQKNGLEMLEGTVSKLVFANPETGWSVLWLDETSSVTKHKVVGVMPGVRAGEMLKVFGNWEQNAKYGPEFKVKRFVVVSPSTELGILKYLSSGLISGIGRGLAQRLVDAFGAETLEVIAHQPKKLREVGGIGPKRSREIRAALRKSSALRKTLVFLQGHGLNLGQAQKVFRRYGEETITRVNENPYRLVAEIRGVGFLTADRMAQTMGISADSPQRAEAALVHELTAAADDGHCFLPANELIARAVCRLEVEKGLVETALARLLDRGLLIKESFVSAATADGDANANTAGPPIYPVWLQRAETATAQHLLRLLDTPVRPLTTTLAKLVCGLETRLGLRFSSLQREAIHKALVEKVVLITGGPGTGKTTLIRAVLTAMRQSKLSVALAAPTGRASRRLKELTGTDAQTIHRLLEFIPKLGTFARNTENPLDADAVIIDEVSMVDIRLAAALLQALKDDSRLILVGDAEQLPSVGPGAMLGDSIASGVIPTVRLTEVFRQATASQIVVAAHAVNQGCAIQQSRNPVGQGPPQGELFHIEKQDPDRAVQIIRRLVTERIPERYGLDPIHDVQVLCPMKRGVLGTENLNAVLREALNPTVDPALAEEPFRPGDKVMQIANNYDKEVFNGDIGVIHAVDRETHTLQVRFDDRLLIYERKEKKELLLAYACTVHKSQGSEYPAVILPIHTQHFIMLQRNLLYTGITRARRLCVIIGPQKAVWRAISNDSIQHRYTGLRERLLHRAKDKGRSRNAQIPALEPQNAV